MYKSIEKYFTRKSAQRIVAETFLRYGFSVKSDGKIYAGLVELPPAKIGRALKVDRRVVIQTAKEIASHESLFVIFNKLQPRAYIGESAKMLGFDCIMIHADAQSSGVVSEITSVLYKNKISIRQIIADDPEFFPDPKLSIIIQGRLSAKAFTALRRLSCAKKITIN